LQPCGFAAICSLQEIRLKTKKLEISSKFTIYILKNGGCPAASNEAAGHPPFFVLPENEKEVVKPMDNNTRIYDRFEWWSVDDCRCDFCVHYQGRGKKQSCSLEACAVADIRREAVRREQAAAGGATARCEGAEPCPA
jgi:hypothetical protein